MFIFFLKICAEIDSMIKEKEIDILAIKSIKIKDNFSKILIRKKVLSYR